MIASNTINTNLKSDHKTDLNKSITFTKKKNEDAVVIGTFTFALSALGVIGSVIGFLAGHIFGNTELSSEAANFGQYSIIGAALSLITVRIANKNEFNKLIRGVFRMGRS